MIKILRKTILLNYQFLHKNNVLRTKRNVIVVGDHNVNTTHVLPYETYRHSRLPTSTHKECPRLQVPPVTDETVSETT